MRALAILRVSWSDDDVERSTQNKFIKTIRSLSLSRVQMPDCDMEIFVSNRFHEHELEPTSTVFHGIFFCFSRFAWHATQVLRVCVRRKVDTITTHKNQKTEINDGKQTVDTDYACRRFQSNWFQFEICNRNEYCFVRAFAALSL